MAFIQMEDTTEAVDRRCSVKIVFWAIIIIKYCTKASNLDWSEMPLNELYEIIEEWTNVFQQLGLDL